MRGKKQIAAVVLAVIFAVTAGMPHSTVYAEPDSTGNAQAADAAADDTQKEEKKEDMTPEELEKKAEEDDGYIIRLYNGKDHKDLDDKIKFNFDIKEAYYTNLKEEKTEEIKVENNTISVKELSQCKFVTIWVK